MDVICLGELLIDFVSTTADASLVGSEGFVKSPGGAPANVAAGVARLGKKSGFIGKVGGDPFGIFLKQVLDSFNVDTSFLVIDDKARTTLSFVAQKKDGKRDCVFYRHPGADMLLSPDEISEEYIKNSKIFHYGSISLINEPSRSATLRALKIAKDNGLVISYDPNLRMDLWDSPESAKSEITYGFQFADIIKISDEEHAFITGCTDIESSARYILDKGPKLVLITLGKDGCYYANKTSDGTIAGFKVNTIETTGAGDSFMSAFLINLLDRIENKLNIFEINENMADMIRFANAAAAITTTKIGAISSLPDLKQVNDLLNAQGEHSWE